MPVISGGKFVLVGSASQVGTAIATQLLTSGARQLVLVDNLAFGTSPAMEALLNDPRCSFVKADVLRLDALLDLLSDADGAFMAAAYMASGLRRDPWAGLDVNIRGLQNVLEACRTGRVKKVVISSSAGVYGALADDPADEESPLRWSGIAPERVLYGASKVIGEGLAKLYHEQHGIDYVALRYSAIYGEEQHGRALVGGHLFETCRRIRQGLAPIIQGAGEQEQDYVYVKDVARANLLAMETNVTAESLNICSGINTSQKQAVELTLRLTGSTLQPEYRPGSSAGSIGTKPVLSREKAKRLLGWEPKVSLELGIGKILQRLNEQA
jgi:UDP-glucose 4-epimerase